MFNSDEFLFGLIDKRITIVSLSVEKMESLFYILRISVPFVRHLQKRVQSSFYKDP